jgi:sugar phosphate isomerase/epimerase
MDRSRRDFIRKSMLTSASLSVLPNIVLNAGVTASSVSLAGRPAYGEARPGGKSINVFSKNLHWLDYNGMASFAAELGFDGVDITVRPEGHVEPGRVADDLPRAVEAVKKAGLQVHMIVTAITKAEDRFTEPILKAAGSLGIGYYRMGWINYDDAKSMDDNLTYFKSQMSAFNELNKKYKIRGDYQNHSGVSFGSPVWDLWLVLKEMDPEWIGSQFDVMHAQVEGGNTWPLGLKLLKDYVKTIDIKDFIWVKKDAGVSGGWKTEVVPIGEGMIDYKKYLGLLKGYGLTGPFSMHYEYPLGGIENGVKKLTIPKEEVARAMKRDLAKFKGMLAEAGI